MTHPTLTVHRSTQEIGGNCIELACGDSRLVLDVGRPLDAPREAANLLPPTFVTGRPVDGVLISHPHQDHYGLLDEIPLDWPVYCGEFAGRLMRLTASLFGKAPEREFRSWRSGVPFVLGPFRVTPLLTDHSAFDAYMILIEVASRRILYSGDFRMHGRKASLVGRMMQSPPAQLDVLLMEGTNLGSDKPTRSEGDLEAEFVSLFRGTPGRVFVCWSAQNIDRTVTLYRACIKARRTLVVDLYTAEVLELLSEAGRLPRPGWNNVKVAITRGLADRYRATGRGDFVARMASEGISAARMAEEHGRWVVMTRPSLLRDFQSKGVQPTPNDAWSYSQWRGYLAQPDGRALEAWFARGGAAHIHTSGHASVADLHAFAAAMNPRVLVPIHGVAWDAAAGFGNVVRLGDGEEMAIGMSSG